MIFLLSPAKTLDYTSTLPEVSPTQPSFLNQSETLINILKDKSAEEIATLMSLSDKLATLNVERYHSWQKEHQASDDCRPALLFFKGDVYQGLNIQSFSPEDLQYAQQHLRILSGLYGVLKPLDLMQPYRLEMGTKLANTKGDNLYQYWGDSLSKHLNELEAETIINVASKEYFSALNPSVLKHNIITPVFKDYKNGKFKIISFYAKKARGSMTAWALKNRISNAEDLTAFNQDGYYYDAEGSSKNELLFLRRKED